MKFIKSFFVIFVLFSADFAVRAQNRSAPDISGRITKLHRSDAGAQTNNLLGSILVERDANASGEYDKADVKITAQTGIYAEADREKRAPLKIDALKLDQRVAVRFAPGPALLTYPIQVGAAEIVISFGSIDSPQNSGSSPKVTQAPKDSNPELTKLRRAIDAGNAVWVEAWAKGDARMILDTFTADGKELVAGGKVHKGRKQILELMRDLMKKRGGQAKLTVTTTDFWLDDNMAYETGVARYEFTQNGQLQVLERRYFTFWKRQSKRGAWKIHSNTGIAKE
ncbi:MAG: nuclear transport factor 2 family protein [Acidobacteriota bacterium]|nr:nuclear transport factor 2 family protein [Acidobacteriota bacterium]